MQVFIRFIDFNDNSQYLPIVGYQFEGKPYNGGFSDDKEGKFSLKCPYCGHTDFVEGDYINHYACGGCDSGVSVHNA